MGIEDRDHELKVEVTAHDEDSGKTFRLAGTRVETVQHFIDALYLDLKTGRKADDRLRCEGDNQDVFQYAHLNIEIYFHQHCAAHVWLFASGTGGASCLVRQ